MNNKELESLFYLASGFLVLSFILICIMALVIK